MRRIALGSYRFRRLSMLLRGLSRSLRTASENPSENTFDAVLVPCCRPWVLPWRFRHQTYHLTITVPVSLGELRTCHSVGLSRCSHRLRCRGVLVSHHQTFHIPEGSQPSAKHHPYRKSTRHSEGRPLGPEPAPPIHHCEGRGSLVLELPLSTPRTRPASPQGFVRVLSAPDHARDFASSDHFRRIGNPGAPRSILTTFRRLSLVLSPPALTRAVRSWGIAVILPDNPRHPSHLPPARSV